MRGGTDTHGEIAVDGSDVANEEIAVPSPVTVSCNAGGTVSVTSPVAIKEITLYDISGRLLKKQPAGGNTEVSLSCAGYPAGVYVMEVLTAEGKSSHKLFLSFAF